MVGRGGADVLLKDLFEAREVVLHLLLDLPSLQRLGLGLELKRVRVSGDFGFKLERTVLHLLFGLPSV